MGSSEFQLKPHHSIPKPDKPLLVIVLDGWGEAEDDKYNAISRADTPCMDSLKNAAPDRWMLLKAHGTAVGLPSDDDMGNSEVPGDACVAPHLHTAPLILSSSAHAVKKIPDSSTIGECAA